MAESTIFDDVFRTMMEKMTYLIVPLINEVFHTSYPENVKIVHLRNEHQLEDGELIAGGRMDEIGKIIDSAEACRKLYKEYGL